MNRGGCLWQTSYPELGVLYRGKVRDCYIGTGKRVIVVTDRISAFDRVFDQPVPQKGRVLNELSVYFTRLAAQIVPIAFLERPHPNVSVVTECDAYPVEMVVRGYLAGSSWRAYEAGERVISGVTLPAGLTRHARLAEPVVTPSTKAESGHDEPISREEIVAQGLVPASEYERLEEMSLALFEQGSRHAQERGLILVDTKYEFGRAPDGTPVLIDEVHTPDSSRYFRQESYELNPEKPEQLSKEFLREWLLEQGYHGQADRPPPYLPDDLLAAITGRYLELYEELTGSAIGSAAAGDLHVEIHEALRQAGYLRGYVAVVVAGSASDRPQIEKITDELRRLGIPCSVRIVSGHRDPRRLLEVVDWVDCSPGAVVWVDVTGLSNAKGPLVGANSTNLVFHCPLDPASPDVFSSLNTPPGVPLAVVARPRNLALSVAKHLALRFPELRARVAEFFQQSRQAGRQADQLHAQVILPEENRLQRAD